MKVDSRESGRAINTTREAPETSQQKIKDDQDQNSPLGQRLGDCGHAGFDNIGSVVIGQYPDPLGENVVLVDLFDLLFDPFDHVAAVLSPQHHDNAADRLLFTVDHGGPLTDGFPDPDFGNIFQISRSAPGRFEHDIFQVGRTLDEPDAPDDILISVFFDHIPAGVLVVLLDRRVNLVHGNAVFQELLGGNDHLILFEIPAEGVDFVHPRNAFQQGVDHPFLDRAQVRQIGDFLLGIGGHGAVEGELVDLPHGRRYRPQGDLDPLGDLLPGFGQPLKDQLPGKVNIEPVFKDNGDQRKAEFGHGAHLFNSRKPAHGHFDGIGHRTLDLQGGKSVGVADDFHLDVGHIGEGIDGKSAIGVNPEGYEERREDQDRAFAVEHPGDDFFQHGSAP